jgi:hypothetical protein
MQIPDKQGKDYGNSNSWSTVNSSRKKSRNKIRDNSHNATRSNTRNGARCNSRCPSKPHNESDKRCYTTPNRFSKIPDVFSRFNKEEKYEPPIPVYVQPVPTGPNYASVTKKDDQEAEEYKDVSTEEYEYKTIVTKIPQSSRTRPTVRNQTPRPNNNVSFGVWEHTYFKHVLELSDIFSEGVNNIVVDTKSFKFLDIFSKFIRECSSGEISPYIEELDPTIDELYMEYTIKRNDF